jgi:hypothetical protein
MMPIMAIQKGMVGGSESEYIRQVTIMADVTGFPSLTVKWASVAIPKISTASVIKKARHPKRYTANNTRGTRDRLTLIMTFCVKKYFLRGIYSVVLD